VVTVVGVVVEAVVGAGRPGMASLSPHPNNLIMH
jgi:hypothetical protein